jgi:hypothetical protein
VDSIGAHDASRRLLAVLIWKPVWFPLSRRSRAWYGGSRASTGFSDGLL